MLEVNDFHVGRTTMESFCCCWAPSTLQSNGTMLVLATNRPGPIDSVDAMLLESLIGLKKDPKKRGKGDAHALSMPHYLAGAWSTLQSSIGIVAASHAFKITRAYQ